jgi:hypothetical protein
MDNETMVRVVAGALALLCVAIIVMRRKSKKPASTEDDF